MGGTVTDTIREITHEHLEKNNGLLLGQCITAVGWIQNTVPSHCRGLVELSMTDVAGPGFAVGAAIVGRRPILVLRFQSFLWLAVSPLMNYAAKSKEIFGYPCPIFVRAIAIEGGGVGPLHSNCYHSIFMHSPGMCVAAPMTPKEYKEVWKYYVTHDDPILVSEHRRSYSNFEELPDQNLPTADATLYAISAARFNTVKAVEILKARGIRCNVVHLVWLKPFELTSRILNPLHRTGVGVIVESAFETAGAAQSIAYTLMNETGCRVSVLGQEDRSTGVARRLENGTPSPEKIADKVEWALKRNRASAMAA